MSQFFFKDKNLKPENIKKGVRIGKVMGTLEGGGAPVRGLRSANVNNQDITADSSTLEQVFTYDEGYDGIGIFTLLPYVLQSKTVNSSTASQTITFDNGYDGLLSVTVNPYTLQSKTVNSSTSSQTVTPDSGYDALSSVTVNPYTLDTKSLDPSLNSQTVNSSADGMSSVSVSAVTASIDSNIQAGNIKDGVTILGVTGNVTSGDWVAKAKKGDSGYTDMSSRTLTISSNDSAYRYANLFLSIGNGFNVTPPNITGSGASSYAFYNFMQNASNVHWHVIDGVNKIVLPFTSLGSHSLDSMFYGTSFSGSGTISFPNLTSVNDYGMTNFVRNTSSYFTIDMPNLTSIGYYGMSQAFRGCANMSLPNFIPNITNINHYGLNCAFRLESGNQTYMSGAVNFTSLTGVGSYGLQHAFMERDGLTSCSFPALVTITDTCAMSNAFYGCSGLTSASFPELTTISGESGMNNCFYNCTSLASISFPKLRQVTASNALVSTFYGCTGITSVSFPELTQIGNQGNNNCIGYCFANTNISSISFPKLSTYYNSSRYSMFAEYESDNQSIVTANVHPDCLSGQTGYDNFLYRCINITNLTLTQDATKAVYLERHPNLSFNSILNVLTHLDLNTSGKSCTFYTSGLTVTDDVQGSLQTAYDDAVNAGWTINNLTITPYTP